MLHFILKIIRVTIFITLLLISNLINGQSEIKTYEDFTDFSKVIISPHIQVNFKKGEEEKIVIHESRVDLDKLNIEKNKNTLRIYLDDAKMTTKHKKIKRNGWTQNVPVYKGTIVKATVYYKELSNFSLRGEEHFEIQDALSSQEIQISLYGDSQVYAKGIMAEKLSVATYGESYLEISEGDVNIQKITAYGESKVNSLNLKSNETRITSYGAATLQVSVTSFLKVTAFGEAKVAYLGSPEIKKGLVIGEAEIQKMHTKNVAID